MDVTPIFVFSLPRAGSTLLQRMLSVHEEISTTGETWLLLPFVYAQREYGVFSEYVHASSSTALREVINQLPHGGADYFKAVRKLATSIYNDLNNTGARYFLDKTPRYYLIIDEISRIFPNAKFIFLFRNPLANLASIIQSFWGGKLGDYRHAIDIYEGPKLLAAGYKAFPHASIRIHYEDLVLKPEATVKRVCNYLELAYNENMLNTFNSIQLKGSMGDSIGTRNYHTVNKHPLDKWMYILGTRYRVSYAKKILHILGDETVRTLGYSTDRLLEDLDELSYSNSRGISDRYYLFKSLFFSILEIPMFKKKMKQYIKLKKYRKCIHF